MNCPSRVDDTLAHEGWNQNPPTFAADTTTRQDLNGTSNSTAHRGHRDDIASLQIDPGLLQESEMSKPDQVSQRNAHVDEAVLMS
jgi:metal iron transporter